MRHTRLLAVGALSLLLHVLVIRAVGPTVVAEPPPATALSLRLQPPPAPVRAMEQPAPSVPLPVTAPARPTAAPAAVPVATPEAVAPPPAPATPVITPLDNVVALESSMPTRYRVRMPPSGTLDYLVTRQDGAQVPAQIAWKTDGNRYTVAADGVTGPLSSAGSIGDTGIAPAEGRMRLANGGDITATFDPDGIIIGAQRYANGIGSQDPASLLLQLVGMGLAAPDQVVGELAINVATAEGPVVMRFDVTENEDLTTPLGIFSTRHLTQLTGAGHARLEVWLAPERGWLPVQLRLTAADGTVTTQAITRMDAPPAPN
jgi:hypothetical protein